MRSMARDAVPTGTAMVVDPDPYVHVMVCPTDGGPVGQTGAADAEPASASAAAARAQEEDFTGAILVRRAGPDVTRRSAITAARAGVAARPRPSGMRPTGLL